MSKRNRNRNLVLEGAVRERGTRKCLALSRAFRKGSWCNRLVTTVGGNMCKARSKVLCVKFLTRGFEVTREPEKANEKGIRQTVVVCCDGVAVSNEEMDEICTDVGARCQRGLIANRQTCILFCKFDPCLRVFPAHVYRAAFSSLIE